MRLEQDRGIAATLYEAIVAVEDVGRIINPVTLAGQSIGAVVQGLGGVLLENLVYDDEGQPQATKPAGAVGHGTLRIKSRNVTHENSPPYISSRSTQHGDGRYCVQPVDLLRYSGAGHGRQSLGMETGVNEKFAASECVEGQCVN